MKFFKRVEKTWRKVYKDKETMRGIYGGFETWLNKYGKEITVAKKFHEDFAFRYS
jgi:hypothetical protein